MKKLVVLAFVCAASVSRAEKVVDGVASEFRKDVNPSGTISMSWKCLPGLTWCYKITDNFGIVVNADGVPEEAPYEPLYDPTTGIYSVEF